MPESETTLPVAVVVWSRPACVQCVATKRKLDQYGIPYIERDLTEHVGQAEEFRNAGYATAPVVVTSRGTWAGFQLNEIKALRDE